MNYSHSLQLFEKAKNVIPSCTQTFSKGWSQYPFGVSPVFLKKADGCFVWDMDGNKFIDWPMALGPVLLGHNYQKINEPVKKQIDSGIAFSLSHYKEIEFAEELCRIIPCAEMVRFGKNGSDATSGAIRAARAYTGRDIIACCGYHGWQDWYIATTSRNKGVPVAVQHLTKTFEYNKISSLKKLFDQYPDNIACVILEPTSLIPPEKGFLNKVNDIAHENGSIVIYDECWTGFRWAVGGAQEFFKVTPDLACFGKALGNGYPISAVVGRREIMSIFDEIFYSFTFGGDLIGITAGLSVLKEITANDVITYIWKLGKMLIQGISLLIDKYNLSERIQVIGYPPKIFLLFMDDNGEDNFLLKSLVQQEMINKGILYAGYHIVSYSHTSEEIKYTLDAYDDVFCLISNNLETNALKQLLKGKPVKPVFRKH